MYFLISRTQTPSFSLGLVDFSLSRVSLCRSLASKNLGVVWNQTHHPLRVYFLTHLWFLCRINKTTVDHCKNETAPAPQ